MTDSTDVRRTTQENFTPDNTTPTGRWTPRSLISPMVNDQALWTCARGISPIVATAIHEGSSTREALRARYSINISERLREEDPYTEFTIRDVPNRIIFHRSRFEVDINRNRNGAVYTDPEQAWGLNVWNGILPDDEVRASLQVHDAYYEMLSQYLQDIKRQFGRFVVLDIHSYNHRRNGPDADPSPQDEAPDVNIGTSSMDRQRWAPVVDSLITHFRSFTIGDKPLDVQENIAFQGRGEQTRFIHSNFQSDGCAIAVEFKKIFMDEWTGDADLKVLLQLRHAVRTAVPLLEKVLMETS
jgi:hypothetical protein